MESVVRWTILWLLTALVATCGQKGPLYLPDEQPGEDAPLRADAPLGADAPSISAAPSNR